MIFQQQQQPKSHECDNSSIVLVYKGFAASFQCFIFEDYPSKIIIIIANFAHVKCWNYEIASLA